MADGEGWSCPTRASSLVPRSELSGGDCSGPRRISTGTPTGNKAALLLSLVPDGNAMRTSRHSATDMTAIAQASPLRQVRSTDS